MTLKSTFSRQIDVIVVPIGRGLARLGFTPNWMTTFGILLTGVAAGLVATGRLAAGGWVLLAGGLADAFDGPVARERGMASRFGAFYDSVADRISDAAILLALAWAVRGDALLFGLVSVALATALLTSYVRAKAESMDADCSVGLLERGERSILTMVGLVITPTFEVVLWMLAVGGLVTVIQRLVHVHRQLAPSKVQA
jgi:CDP-diacylglycerol--glycerol-3-phosphate 3-phosphatidyltransferase